MMFRGLCRILCTYNRRTLCTLTNTKTGNTPTKPPTVPRVTLPYERLTFTFAKSAGPGGQAVNKRCTKAVLRFKVSEADWLPESVKQHLREKYPTYVTQETDEFVITSQRYSSQDANRKDCLAKLQQIIDDSVAETSGIPSKTELKIQRLRKAKERQRRKARKTQQELQRIAASLREKQNENSSTHISDSPS